MVRLAFLRSASAAQVLRKRREYAKTVKGQPHACLLEGTQFNRRLRALPPTRLTPLPLTSAVTLLRAVEEADQVRNDGRSIGLRLDIGLE
jgi:hypothetical protein